MKNSVLLFLSLFLLVFVYSCKKSTVSGPLNSTGTASDLSGTKWTVYQYRDATSSVPQSRNDTLMFTDATNYSYNHSPYTYSLSTGSYTHLTLNSTPFGSISGTVPTNFIQNGEIIAVPFSQVPGSLTYYLWMKKI